MVMSPANKFWVGIFLLMFIAILIICPSLALGLVIIHQISTIIGYAVKAEWKHELENYKKTFFWKTSIFYLIHLFNQYLNNKFSKK